MKVRLSIKSKIYSVPAKNSNPLILNNHLLALDQKNRNSIDSDIDNTDDFGGQSNVGSGISGYNIDDFEIIDSDLEDKLIVDAPMDADLEKSE